MVIVFDVDGTILDTFPHIKASYLTVFKKLLPDFVCTEALLKSFFGPPLPDTFRNIVNEDEIDKFVDEYHRVSRANIKEYLRTFPDTIKTLDKLKAMGFKLAVSSNKQKKAILEAFELVGLNNYFDLIIGYDSVKFPKPHKEGLEQIKAYFKDDAILVGDSIFDILTAQNAGVKSIGVTWALTTESELIEAGADYVINNFNELIEIVKGL